MRIRNKILTRDSLIKLSILMIVPLQLSLNIVDDVREGIGNVLSATSPWTQTDWSGGSILGTVGGNVNTFESISNLDTSVVGEVSLLSESDWAYPEWYYRTDVTFANANPEIADYQVYFELNTETLINNLKLSAGCEDIRLSDELGNPLPYWIETGEYSCDTTNTRIWTKHTFPNGDTQIDVYYGNPTAVAEDDGDSIFEFFDDFEDDVIDSVKWEQGTIGATTGTNFSEANGFLNGGNSNRYLQSIQSFTGDYVAETRIYEDVSAGNGFSSVGFWSSTSNSFGILVHSGTTYIRNNSSWISIGSFGLDKWSRDMVRVIGTSAYGERRAENDSQLNTYTNTNSSGISSEKLRLSSRYDSGTYNQNYDNDWDWIFVRKAVSSPPTNGVIGTEVSKYSADTGYLISNVLDAGVGMDWGIANYSIVTGGTFVLKIRTDSNSDMSTATTWASCTGVVSSNDVSSNNCVNDADRYIQYRLDFEADGAISPIFQDISIAFSPSDIVAPDTNLSNIDIDNFSDGDWIATEPQINWDEGTDNLGGSGILGYCVSLDEVDIGGSNLLDPEFTSGALAGKNDGIPQEFCPFIVSGAYFDINNVSNLDLIAGKQYYFSARAVDFVGNVYTGSTNTWQDLISFKYDNQAPTAPFYISLPANFLSSKDVVVTWPVGVGGADDLHSGLAGLQYRIGDSGTWYGDLHTGTEDINDLLINDGSYVTDETYDYPELVEGNNLIYVRAVDNLGNVTAPENYVKGLLKLNTVAPSPVRNLTVNPLNADVNAYTFTWDVPSTYTGSSAGITYCYAVNAIPSVSNCTFTDAGVTSLGPDAFATQPGENTMYVVAKDEAGNINYATYSEPGSSVTYTYSGTAPGITQNLDVADISVKATENWRLVLSWDQPTNVGAGISYYNIYRSGTTSSCNANFAAFTKVGSSTSTSYIDPNLEQKLYNYCIKACDSANNCSASSGTVGRLPTGKFTEPAELLSPPEVVSFTTRKAVINWITDRVSDSSVQFGLETGVYFEEEISNSLQIASHTITLNNLQPGTTYYYRAKWTDVDGNIGVSEEKTFATLPPPRVLEVNINEIRTDSALVTFTVNSATSVDLLYGSTLSYGGTLTTATSTTESTYTSRITNLNEDSIYNFKFILRDIEGNDYDSIENHRFTTLPTPRVQDIQVQEVKNSAQPTVDVNWTSNVPISSQVTYYPLDNVDQKRDKLDVELKTEHETSISELQPNRRYGMIITGRDAIGNQAESDEYQFTTAADSRPPAISNIKVETRVSNTSTGEQAQTQLIITWDTDEEATSQIEYGEGANGTYTQRSLVDDNLTFNHLVIVNNLRPSSVYHFRVVSADSAGNESTGKNVVTITAQVSENPLDIIISRLTEVFGFIR
jgi:hypothetical protein